MSSYVPAALKRSVRIQFADRCAYCQTAEALTVTTFEIEHIVPLAEGGATELTNLCLSCPTCNRHKATHTTAIDPQTRESVPLFHPQQELWEKHFSWNIEATELIGLTAIGRATIELLKINRPQMVRVRKMWVKMGEHPPTRKIQ